MDVISTAREAYQPVRAEPVRPVKPAAQLQVGGGRFEAQSEAQKQFQPRAQEPRAPGKIEGSFHGDGAVGRERPVLAAHVEPAKPVKPQDNGPLAEGKFEGEPMSRAYAPYKGVAPPQSYRPQQKPLNNGKFEGSTEAQSSFNPKPVVATRVKPLQEYHPNPAPFEGVTETQATFQARPTERAQPIRHAAQDHSGGKFYGDTTNRDTYVTPTEVSRAQPIRPAAAARPTGRFEGETEAHTAFKSHPIEPHAARPKAQYQPNSVPFEGRTEAQVAFVPVSAERPVPVRPQGNLQGGGQFFGETTNAAAFVGHKPSPPKSFKPQQGYDGGSKFEGNTTSRAVYTPKHADRAQPIKPKTSPRSNAPFQGETEAHAQYPPKAVPRAQPKRPQDHDLSEHGRFEGHTTYGDAHTGVRGEPAKPAPRAGAGRLLPDGRFDAVTEAAGQFSPKVAALRSPIRPTAQLVLENGRFDAVTTSRAVYTPKQAQQLICPAFALQIESSNADLKMEYRGREFGAGHHGQREDVGVLDYVKTTDDGHEFYAIHKGQYHRVQ